MTVANTKSTWRLKGILLTILCALSVGGCGSGDDGTNPAQFGAVEGVVRLPFRLAASGEPIAGAAVQLTAGDFDTVTTTDETGTFFLDQVPARQASLSATLGNCLAVTGRSVVVRANDTVLADLTLESHADRDTISVGWAGATRMEIDPATHRAVLLYDAAARGGTPGIVTLDLTTGQFARTHIGSQQLDE